MSHTKIKGYKIFDPNFRCRGFQYAENTEYKMEEKPSACNRGFHFCTKPSDCFSYYSFDPSNIICKVESLGDTDLHNEDSKVATNHILIGKRLSWTDVLILCNTGSNNSGHSNSGNRNSGNWNSGYSNSGYRSSGAFCTDKNPTIELFNKPSKFTAKEWEDHKAVQLMYSVDPCIFVEASLMSESEKESNPKYETIGGYIKKITMKEAWANAWHNWSDENKKVFTSLPNFDSKIFEEITGIKTN